MRSIAIGPKERPEGALIDVEAGKLIEARKCNVGHRIIVKITIEAQPQLIDQVRREVMIFGNGDQIVIGGDGPKEGLRKTRGVDRSCALQNKKRPRS